MCSFMQGCESGFVSDPTFKEVSAPTPDPDTVSDPATLVSASRELRGKLALYGEITTIYKVFKKVNLCKVGYSGTSNLFY
jgi:hypothetical protein